MAAGADRWGFLSRVSRFEIALSSRREPSSAIVCKCARAWVFVGTVKMVDDGCVGGGVDYCCNKDVGPCQSNRSTGAVVFYCGGGFNGGGDHNGAAAPRLTHFIELLFDGEFYSKTVHADNKARVLLKSPKTQLLQPQQGCP